MATTQPNSCQTISWDSKACPINEKCITEMGLRYLGFCDTEGFKCFALPFAPSKDESVHLEEHFQWHSRGMPPTMPWVWLWTRYDKDHNTIVMQLAFQNVEFHKDKTKMSISYETVKKAATVYMEDKVQIIRVLHLFKQ